MRHALLFSQGTALIFFILLTGCGGGGGDGAGESADESIELSLSESQKSAISAGSRTLSELSKVTALWCLAGSDSFAASTGIESRVALVSKSGLRAVTFGDCPVISLSVSNGVSYGADFGSGCNPAGLQFRVSGSMAGSVSHDGEHFTGTSTFSNLSTGTTTIDGSSQATYSLAADTDLIVFSGDWDLDQTFTSSDLSVRAVGGVQQQYALTLSGSEPSVQISIPNAGLALTVNGTQQFNLSATDVQIDSSDKMIPSRGTLLLADDFSTTPSTITVSFDGNSPSTGIVTVTIEAGGSTDTTQLDLDDLPGTL